MRLAVGLILLNTRFFMQWRADEWFNRRPRSNIATTNSFGARASLSVGEREYEIYRLEVLRAAGPDVQRLPYSLRISSGESAPPRGWRNSDGG
jgi:hypothetical protein